MSSQKNVGEHSQHQGRSHHNSKFRRRDQEDSNDNDAHQFGEGHEIVKSAHADSFDWGKDLGCLGEGVDDFQGMESPVNDQLPRAKNRDRERLDIFGEVPGNLVAANNPQSHWRHQGHQGQQNFGPVPPTSFNPGEIPLMSFNAATGQTRSDPNDDEYSDLLFNSPWQAFVAKNKRHEEELRRAQEDALLEPDRTKDDIPWDPKEQRRYVKQAMDAIKNVRGVIDGKTKVGKDAQSVRRMKGNYYSTKVIEIVAWEIISAAINCQAGIRLVDPFHGTKHEEYDSFDDRFDATLEALKRSKAACKQLFDPAFIHRLVDAPVAELEKKGHNKKINKRRNEENAAGRVALQKKNARRNGNESQSENDTAESAVEQVTSSHRRKTRSFNKNKAATNPPKRNNSEPMSHDEDDSSTKNAVPTTSDDNSSQGYDLSLSMSDLFPTQVNPRARAPGLSAPKLSHESRESLRNQYMVAICTMLGISVDWKNRLTLEDLRLYARAYNPEFGRRHWAQQPLQGFRGVGQTLFRVVGDYQDHHQHFSLAPPLQHLVELARERGDLDEHSFPTFAYNPILPRMDFDHQALGTVDNPFGIWERR